MSNAPAPAMSTEAERIAFLKPIAPFDYLSESDLILVAKDFRARLFRKQEMIFQQGDTNREVYVIVRGKVRIFKNSLAGHETSINISSTGALIGEFAPIDGQPRSASAVALEECLALEMRGERFERHMHDRPGLALGVARILTHKIRLTATYAETIAQHDAAGRLMHILLLYNEEFGKEIEAGKRYALNLRLNQEDLASLVGTRRENINRILRDWHKRGLIEYKDGEFIFLDLPSVKQERDSLKSDL
jgi:CRP-like cAMP-binding protein